MKRMKRIKHKRKKLTYFHGDTTVYAIYYRSKETLYFNQAFNAKTKVYKLKE